MLAKRLKLGAELAHGNNTDIDIQSEEDSARNGQLSPNRTGCNPFFIWANGRSRRVAGLWHFKPAAGRDFLNFPAHIRKSGVPH